ncbi:hypothetical protein CSB11_00250 [Candidatus Campbellbacteria bacterium]|nr:MAG: hypothetical protein CSB11_00250 [Candidatus Campbellbacteria bacterium]
MSKHKEEKKHQNVNSENFEFQSKEIKNNKISKINLVTLLALILVIIYLVINHTKGLTPEKFDKSLEDWKVWKEQEEMSKMAEKFKVTKSDHVYGKEDAEITIFEYSDFECPFCKRFASTPKEVVDKYDGKVNTVFRHLPLPFHNPLAAQAAAASECVAEKKGKDGFYAFHDQYFTKTKAGGKGMTFDEMLNIGVGLGLDKKELEICINSEETKAKVTANMKQAQEAGITGTPGVVIKNNKTNKILRGAGAEPIEAIEDKIEKLLK